MPSYPYSALNIASASKEETSSLASTYVGPKRYRLEAMDLILDTGRPLESRARESYVSVTLI
jgi:hypothetical protein